MNRQQRRAAQKRGITAKELQQEHLAGIQYAVKAYSVAVAMVMHDKLGFGSVRTNRVMAQIQDLFDSIEKGYVTIKDLEETLYEECGLVFKD